MASAAFEQVIERLATDDAFAAQLQSDKETALTGYDLTAEEKAALIDGDAAQLQAMGVDERVSKRRFGL
jgi:hypothetical protein